MNTPRGSGRRRGSGVITMTPWMVLISILVVIVLTIGAFVVGHVFNRDVAAAREVRLESTFTAGENPFTSPVGVDESNLRPPPKVGGSHAGSTPQLYGGSGQQASCDPARLIEFLNADQGKSSAWASVLGIRPEEIKDYIAGLTSVILRSDTAVTNHGFKDGQATAIPAVLQAGTAVLVDMFGEPVVKCYCGNPLKPPVSYSQPRYSGKTWSGFSPTEVTIIKKSDVVVNKFTLVHPRTGKVVPRTPGVHHQPPPPLLPRAPRDQSPRDQSSRDQSPQVQSTEEHKKHLHEKQTPEGGKRERQTLEGQTPGSPSGDQLEVKLPKVELPKEQPEVKLPKVELPKEQPEVKLPKVELPKEQPEVKLPKVELPKEQPEVKLPKVQLPKEQPAPKSPKVQLPKEQPAPKSPGFQPGSNRPDRSERSGPARPERSERSGPARSDRPERSERSGPARSGQERSRG